MPTLERSQTIPTVLLNLENGDGFFGGLVAIILAEIYDMVYALPVLYRGHLLFTSHCDVGASSL